MDSAGRAAGHGEILAGDVDGSSAYLSAPGDDAVGGEGFIGHPKQRGAVLCEEAGFLKGIAIEKGGQPLPGGELALTVLLGRAVRAGTARCCARRRVS